MLCLPLDKNCIVCGGRMNGINDYRLRKKCEGCGGNMTKYDADNPNPQNLEAVKRKRTSA